MNRIIKKLQENKKLLSVYFTAGYPELEDSVSIIKALEASGVDMIEIGIPFSDPLADGATIQDSGTQALKNGMTLKKLFGQLKNIRTHVSIPLIAMGYLNPIMQYGVARFCEKCKTTGIDGVIIPDLPISVYEQTYKGLFEKHGIRCIFLISPQTPENRIRHIDSLSEGFIYMVSSAGTTGVRQTFAQEQQAYFNRISKMGLKNELIVGFGVANKTTFKQATQYAKGAIVGSAFIKMLSKKGLKGISDFVDSIQSP